MTDPDDPTDRPEATAGDDPAPRSETRAEIDDEVVIDLRDGVDTVAAYEADAARRTGAGTQAETP